MSRVSEVTEAMVRAVPARKASLNEVEVARLRELTRELIAAKPEAAAIPAVCARASVRITPGTSGLPGK